MKAAVVVPTIRESHLADFLGAWAEEFAGQLVIVVEDNPQRSFAVRGAQVRHYSWAEIDAEFGADAWIFPRRTDCVRSYGYYKAFQAGVDMIVTLDDDCYPAGPGFLARHYQNLAQTAAEPAWVSTGRGTAPRGMPYQAAERRAECVLSHGLWRQVPDFDAVTQLANARFGQPFEPVEQVIPKGKFFPLCGMNVAFKPQLAPAMYFLLMGRDWPYDRFGDIWCGLFAKKICDHLGLAVRSGEPAVEHQRASNVWANLRKELPGYEINETLWQAVDALVLTESTVRGCYQELAENLPAPGEYWEKLKTAMHIWAGLFPERESQPEPAPPAVALKAT